MCFFYIISPLVNELIELNQDQNYLCLECGKEFKNDLNLAICPECLKREEKNYRKGIPSKYVTVSLYLRKKAKF